MTRSVRLAAILLTVCFFSRAQTGNFFLSHYTPSDERIDYLTFSMMQDDRGVLYFANKNGVLEFDGRNWNLVPTPGPVYTLVAAGQEVFVGGFKGFGKLTLGRENTRKYEPLSTAQPEPVQVTASLFVKNKLYFLAEQRLYIVSPASGVTEKVIKSDAQDSFTGLFEIVGNVYINSETKGLLKIDQGKLVKANFELPGGLPILFCTTLPGTNRVLVASATNRLFVFDATTGLREINLKDKTFLENNVMVNGTWVNEKLIALSTLRGGVLFVNPSNGVTEEITNYFTGLPDNEVYAILTDRHEGVWVAHDYGFTRIAPYLPFRSFSHYPGLTGNLLCARSFNDQIYVGTTLGLYTLVREEVYIDEPYYTTVPRKTATTTKEGIAKGVNGFLSLFKRDKNKQKKTTEVPPSKGKANTGKATRKVLKSLQYVYKKVEGVDGKVNQLTEANGMLLASGITGVMEVEGQKSKTIAPEPVKSVFYSTSVNQLLISTLDESLRSFRREKTGWKETHLLDTLSEDVSYIFEDKLQNIWLCGKANVFKVETVDHQITDVSNIPFSNPSLDEPVGLAMGSEVYLAASEVFDKYDIRKNRFDRFDTLRGPKKYFASAGYFWFYDGRRWHTFDDKRDKAMKLEWLRLFQNIRYLSPTSREEGLWVITAANELYRFSSNRLATESSEYPLFLREVRGQQNKIAPAKAVKVSQLESTVAFEFVQPDYVGMSAIEYRYKVPGLNKDWSVWSPSNNIVNFPYLPTGTYKVEVETKNLMDQESKVEIDLEVEPPYWKQSWFYASELAFFSMLVILSLKLSSGNSKYRYISQLLSVLTVIMLIQFIQTMVTSLITVKSTPVIDFFIQVFIALLVLPIEGLLRKFMIRSKEDQVKTAHLWDNARTGK
jgi:hypothetical protein